MLHGPADDQQSLCCPVCQSETDSLKQYRYVSWYLFLLIGDVWEPVYYRACPSCMRRFIWKKCLLCIVPANLAWIVVLFPWAILLTAASFVRGHSRSILRGVTVEIAVDRDNELRDFGNDVTLAVDSILVCWLPPIGLFLAFASCIYNRSSRTWIYRLSQVGLILSLICHVTLAALILCGVDVLRLVL